MTALHIAMTLFTGVVGDASGSLMGVDGSFFDFAVQESGATVCTPKTCPGSFYTAIATAWANIGYLTHADVLRFLNTTNFGKWAILLYIAAAITGLLGVATNSPMRNYTWFFIGPALYSFLVGTTMPVQGVNWVVANQAVPDMSEVWKNAEAGLSNTRLAKDGIISINGKDGPAGQYEVAMPMVFLDELFSATSNILIEWTGIGREVAGRGSNTNLANPTRNPEGPWWLLSTLKWGYLENIVSVSARNPDVRDALVTFLASECGDKFKEGINSGAYIAATQSRGATAVRTVMVGAENGDYTEFLKILSSTSIPTPRSVGRLFKEKDTTGSFRRFSQNLKTGELFEAGRNHGIVCSEYLWVIIQALRFEAGSAYYQLLRSSPKGLNQQEFVNTILYAWDVREEPNTPPATYPQQEAFLKHLMLAYLVRNELLYAPQITSVDQRFAPSEQARSYSDAYVRSYGSKAKFIELYNAAIMMPYLQGILAYFLIVAYPLACMLVILPGHYKGFFTWVSFFAWIKLWDVGFAMVQVLERSVWAMIGNHSHMASTAQVLINTAKDVGGIAVEAPFRAPLDPNSQAGQAALEALAAVPVVCSLQAGTVNAACGVSETGANQALDKAMQLFDKMLLTSANLDLDLSNGWYIYIMSALYLAVPAVTGQLVLGAKAGSAGLIKDAFSGVGNDGSNAAKTGAQHKDVAALTTNQRSLGQAARAKGLRKATGDDGMGPSLATQGMAYGNKAADLGVENAGLAGKKDFLSSKAGLAGRHLDSYDRGAGLFRSAYGAADKFHGGFFPSSTGGNGGGGDTTNSGHVKNALGGAGDIAHNSARVALGRRADNLNADAVSKGADIGWNTRANEQMQGAYKDAAGKMASSAEYEADSSAWEAKNEFAAHASAMGGIAGMNSGSLAPGEKPLDTTQLAVSGNLDGFSSAAATKGGTLSGKQPVAYGGNSASNAAWYSKDQLPGKIDTMQAEGLGNYGGNKLSETYQERGGGSYSAHGSFNEATSQVKEMRNWYNNGTGTVTKMPDAPPMPESPATTSAPKK